MFNYLKYNFKKIFYRYKYNIFIHSNSIDFKALNGHECEFMEQTSIDGKSSIGSYVYVGKNTFITKAQVGNYVQIGSESAIGPGEHNTKRLSINSIFMENAYDQLTDKEIEVGNDVWIGTHVVILRGVKIGNGAVIGAGAVVTKDIEPYGIYVGVPAKLIKYRFDKKTRDILEKAKWWNYEPEEVKEIFRHIEINNKDDEF